jgi:D-beta-D-heptose 7-phosphate kinase/D-beta-D-heptose 1-phosphate adenosyltransferase
MISVKQAEKTIKAFAGKRILVVGDLMLDRYVTGSVNRISPEAPVPVVLVTGERTLPGGAANVALNIQSLGGQAMVAGVVGKDAAADDLLSSLSQSKIQTDGILAYDSIRTTVKTRVMADRQQIVRVDREDTLEPSSSILKDLCKKIAGLMSDVDGVIIEDYGKGVISQGIVDTVMASSRASKIPVGFDPKENETLKMVGITLATPNYKEACTAAGLKESALRNEPSSDPVLKAAGEILMKKWEPDFLIITLGAQGMYLLTDKKQPQIIPTKAREVFDVSGAGDTVIATAFLCLVGGASYYDAASVANYAAGVVVGKLGTATCSPKELIEYIGS